MTDKEELTLEEEESPEAEEALELAIYVDRYMKCIDARAGNAESAAERDKLQAAFSAATGLSANSFIAKSFVSFAWGFDAGLDFVLMLERRTEKRGLDPLQNIKKEEQKTIGTLDTLGEIKSYIAAEQELTQQLLALSNPGNQLERFNAIEVALLATQEKLNTVVALFENYLRYGVKIEAVEREQKAEREHKAE